MFPQIENWKMTGVGVEKQILFTFGVIVLFYQKQQLMLISKIQGRCSKENLEA